MFASFFVTFVYLFCFCDSVYVVYVVVCWLASFCAVHVLTTPPPPPRRVLSSAGPKKKSKDEKSIPRAPIVAFRARSRGEAIRRIASTSTCTTTHTPKTVHIPNHLVSQSVNNDFSLSMGYCYLWTIWNSCFMFVFRFGFLLINKGSGTDFCGCGNAGTEILAETRCKEM